MLEFRGQQLTEEQIRSDPSALHFFAGNWLVKNTFQDDGFYAFWPARDQNEQMKLTDYFTTTLGSIPMKEWDETQPAPETYEENQVYKSKYIEERSQLLRAGQSILILNQETSGPSAGIPKSSVYYLLRPNTVIPGTHLAVDILTPSGVGLGQEEAVVIDMRQQRIVAVVADEVIQNCITCWLSSGELLG